MGNSRSFCCQANQAPLRKDKNKNCSPQKKDKALKFDSNAQVFDSSKATHINDRFFCPNIRSRAIYIDESSNDSINACNIQLVPHEKHWRL